MSDRSVGLGPIGGSCEAVAAEVLEIASAIGSGDGHRDDADDVSTGSQRVRR